MVPEATEYTPLLSVVTLLLWPFDGFVTFTLVPDIAFPVWSVTVPVIVLSAIAGGAIVENVIRVVTKRIPTRPNRPPLQPLIEFFSIVIPAFSLQEIQGIPFLTT